MATRARRTRTDSIQAQTAAFRSATASHAWPSIVPGHPDADQRQVELALFGSILAERASDDWTPLALVTAARAAALSAFVMIEQALAITEGAVVPGGRHGADVANPRLAAIGMANSALVTTMRTLGLSTPVVDRKALVNSGKASREARAVLDRAKGDPLLHGDGADLLA